MIVRLHPPFYAGRGKTLISKDGIAAGEIFTEKVEYSGREGGTPVRAVRPRMGKGNCLFGSSGVGNGLETGIRSKSGKPVCRTLLISQLNNAGLNCIEVVGAVSRNYCAVVIY